MNYIFFLKRQLFNFALIVMLTVCTSRRFGWYGVPAEYMIVLSLTYIFAGAYVRGLMYGDECDFSD